MNGQQRPGPGLPQRPADPLWHRQVRHDVRHELATIMMLARALAGADDVGPASRARIGQLLDEVRWLDELIGADDGPPARGPVDPLRVDAAVGAVVAGRRMVGGTRVSFTALEAWASIDRLALGRTVRNLVDNACTAAGPDGTVLVRVVDEDGSAVVTVADDGPGFDAGTRSRGRLGLTVVRDTVRRFGGSMRIDRGELGGCRVTVRLPEPGAARTLPEPGAARTLPAGTQPATAPRDGGRP